MHRAPYVLTRKVVILAAGLLLAVTAGFLARMSGRHPAQVVVSAVPPLEAAPPPAVVPAGEPEQASDWVATGDGRVAVLFSYHREPEGCGGPCENYAMTLRFQEKARGAEPSWDWHQVAVASCERFRADGVPEDICVRGDPLAGRDRHGNDYALAPFSVTREQLVRMFGAKTVVLQVGALRLPLSRDVHGVLRQFLGSAGRSVPR